MISLNPEKRSRLEQVLGRVQNPGYPIPIGENITHVLLEVGANAHEFLWTAKLSGVEGIDPARPIHDQAHVLVV